jgi:SAM-dependent methyltransferase
MPSGLKHQPGETFDWSKSEVIQWLIAQPAVQAYIFNKVKGSGAIEYDPESKAWRGCLPDDRGGRMNTTDTPARIQDEGLIALHTKLFMEAGRRIFQIYQVGGSEEAHCAFLLEKMRPRRCARIADVGCGIGEVADQMHRLRPDLSFVLFNTNQWQLDHCPDRYPGFMCDMHRLTSPEEYFDVVMVNYALGYAHLPSFLKEVARVLKPGGTLFIYDMVPRRDDRPCSVMDKQLNYTVHPIGVMAYAADRAGFSADMAIPVMKANREHLDICEPRMLKWLELVDKEVVPWIWQFTKYEQPT